MGKLYELEFLEKYKTSLAPRAEDITGIKVEKIKVLFPVRLPDKRVTLWVTECDCGNYTVNYKANILKGAVNSCGQSGCKKLSVQFKTQEVFLEQVKNIHGDKYDYSLVEYKSSKDKVKILCNKHGVFESTPTNLLSGRGCSSCGRESRIEKRKFNLDVFLDRAKSVHGNKFDYSKVNYINSQTKVNIICPVHGEFQQIPNDHYRYGCNSCASDARVVPKSEFFSKLVKVHSWRYSYDSDTYTNSDGHIRIFCEHHGWFNQKAAAHLRGHGCSRCADDLLSKTQDEFIKDANKVHNNKYIYEESVYTKSYEDITILCPTHGYFTQLANSHLQGAGCPHCATSGFKRDVEGSFYITRWEGFGEEFIKFGVTNNEVKIRVKQQSWGSSLNYNILYDFRFYLGDDAWTIERDILKNFDCGVCPKQWLPDGYTETTHVENLPKILNYIQTNYGLNPEDYKYKDH